MKLLLSAIVACLLLGNKKGVSGIGKLEFSPNRKLNTLLSAIRDKIIDRFDSDEDMELEISRYKSEFKREPDFNFVQYGNLEVYYDDVRDFYKSAGYADSTIDRMSNDEIWELYKRQVGWVLRNAKEFRDL